jgi:shikimate kinase
MEPTVVSALEAIRQGAFTLSLWAFAAVNLTAAAVVVFTRNRSLVQRFTSPWLAANIILLGTGVGVPLAAGLAKSVVEVVGTAVVQPGPAPLD